MCCEESTAILLDLLFQKDPSRISTNAVSGKISVPTDMCNVISSVVYILAGLINSCVSFSNNVLHYVNKSKVCLTTTQVVGETLSRSTSA